MDELDADGYGTWSGVLALLSAANRTYEARYVFDANPADAADRLRTIARLLEAAATEVREDELARIYRASAV